MSRTGLVLVLIGVLLNAFAQFCLKASTHVTGPIALSAGGITAGLGRVATLPWFWAGGACYALSLIVWILALSRVPVTIAYPMLSVGYIVNALAARLWLGETLGPAKLAGIGIIVLGVFILAQSRAPGVAP
ncbi:MAG TPA: EamA family transporter [Steroidobacteraceae bacterium]|nr:EamA family transporter [Steroidobacteraceae bacterium]